MLVMTYINLPTKSLFLKLWILASSFRNEDLWINFTSPKADISKLQEEEKKRTFLNCIDRINFTYKSKCFYLC